MLKQTNIDSQHRSGSTYIAVIGVSLIVSMIALGGIQVGRVRLQRAQHEADLRQARILAMSAVEAASAVISYDIIFLTDWRQNTPHDVETGSTNLGNGSISYRIVDPDGDLDDDSTDRVLIYGYGRVGDATWVEKAEARMDTGRPLSALQYAIHARNTVQLKSGTSLTVNGSAASTDSHFLLNNGSSISGDAVGRFQQGNGNIDGTFTSTSTSRGFPSRSVIDFYRSRATTLSAVSSLSNGLLSAQRNDFGGEVNPDGVYYLNTGGADITIDNLRLSGTLIVDAGLGEIEIQECLMENGRDDFPTLILIGNATFDANQAFINESQVGRSLNPVGCPYLGEEDSDQLDQFPVSITGLVHVIGSMEISTSTTNLRGTLLVEGPVLIESSCTIDYLPQLVHNPPIGYAENSNASTMVLSRGSWTRESAP